MLSIPRQNKTCKSKLTPFYRPKVIYAFFDTIRATKLR